MKKMEVVYGIDDVTLPLGIKMSLPAIFSTDSTETVVELKGGNLRVVASDVVLKCERKFKRAGKKTFDILTCRGRL